MAKKKKLKKEKKVKLEYGKKKVFLLDLHPYRQCLLVVVNGQFSDALAWYKKQDASGSKENLKYVETEQLKDKEAYIDDFKGGANGKLYTTLPVGYVMLISHDTSWINTTNTVLHEALHVAHYVLRRAGLTLCENSEEAYTYFTGWVAEQVLREIY